jgi:hypothetical protein
MIFSQLFRESKQATYKQKSKSSEIATFYYAPADIYSLLQRRNRPEYAYAVFKDESLCIPNANKCRKEETNAPRLKR